jgi:hypothetical protein
MTTFQPGQKVRYIGGYESFEGDPPYGAIGTVIARREIRGEALYVDFVIGVASVFATELEAAS